MKTISALLIALLLSACANQQPPPTPDRSNIRPINDEAAIEIIRAKVSHKP